MYAWDWSNMERMEELCMRAERREKHNPLIMGDKAVNKVAE